MLQAYKAEDMVPNDGMDTRIDDGKYGDFSDGRYEKTTNVKICRGNLITIKFNLKNTVENVKTQIEEKTNPGRTPTSREPRKRLDGRKKVEGL